MASRPITQKKLARLRKAVGRRPLPAYIDLIEWLKDRRYAQSNREARLLLLDGRVRSESHIVGRESILTEQGQKHIVQPRVPASMRSTLQVR